MGSAQNVRRYALAPRGDWRNGIDILVGDDLVAATQAARERVVWLELGHDRLRMDFEFGTKGARFRTRRPAVSRSNRAFPKGP